MTTTIAQLRKEINTMPRYVNGRIQYTLEFKDKVARLALETNTPPWRLADELGMRSKSNIYNWIRDLQDNDINRKAISVSRKPSKDSQSLSEARHVQFKLMAKKRTLQEQIVNIGTEIDAIDGAMKVLKSLGV